jgi:hypothetical protein
MLARTDRAQSDLRNEAAVQLRQPPALKVAYVARSVRACSPLVHFHLSLCALPNGSVFGGLNTCALVCLR